MLFIVIDKCVIKCAGLPDYETVVLACIQLSHACTHVAGIKKVLKTGNGNNRI
jgi:hypothetical protein